MQVIFKSVQALGGKVYKAKKEPQEVPDKLAQTMNFKSMVARSVIEVVAKDQAAQKIQAQKDYTNFKKAQAFREAQIKSKQLQAQKAGAVPAQAEKASPVSVKVAQPEKSK